LATPAAAAYPPGWWEAQFMLYKQSYGPNEAVTIQVGSLSPGCDPFEGIVRISDVYVVPTGAVTDGGSLTDVSGQPNTFSSATQGGLILDEIIGITRPSGAMGSGTYDVVEDVCQNGRFDADMDAIIEAAFTVSIPSDIPSLPDPALIAIKDQAQAQWELWRTASPYLHLLGATIIIGTLPTDALDLVQEIAVSGITWMMSCISIGDCQFNIGAFEIWNIFMQMALVAAAQASHYKGLAADPPSPDYADPVELAPALAYSPDPENPVERAALDYLRSLDDSTRLTQGLLDAMERYQGAQWADDAPAALLQAQTASALSTQLRTALTRENTSADALVAALSATGYNQSARVSSIRSWQQRVVTSGLNVADRAALANLGLDSPAEQERFRQFILDLPTEESYSSLSSFVSQTKSRNNSMATPLNNFATAFDGLAATITSLMDDSGAQPYPTVTVAAPATSTVGQPVPLTATATSAAGVPTLTWDFDGDGDFDDVSGDTVAFTPSRPGPQRVGVQATAADGRSAITYVALDPKIVGTAPTVTATPASNTIQGIYVGDQLDLTAAFADADGDPLTVTWLDGDNPATPVGDTLTVSGEAGRRVRGVSAQATDPAGNRATARWTVLSFDPDADQDGWTDPVDCAPANPAVNPGRAEVPGNGLDDDCDPTTPDTGPPVASFSTSPAVAVVGQAVTFTSTSTAPNGSVRSYAWDLTGDSLRDSTAAAPSHTYTATGDVPVTLTVTDNTGATGTITQNLHVTDRPIAQIGASPGDTVPADTIVTLSDLSTDADGGVVAREWDLDYDGLLFRSETTVANPQVQLGRPTTVALRVTDVHQVVSEIATLRLTIPGPPVADFTTTPVAGDLNIARPIYGASIAAYSSQYSASYPVTNILGSSGYWATAMGQNTDQWVIIDLGASYEVSGVALQTSIANFRPKDIRLSVGSDPNDPASFTPWVEDQLPNTSATFTFRAIGHGPVGRYLKVDLLNNWGQYNINLSQVQVYTPQIGLPTVQFTDRSIDPEADGGVTGWFWSFGDGSTSTEPNPIHTYAQAGAYTVTLTVEDAEGLTATTTRTYTVRIPLDVSFTMSTSMTMSTSVAALGQEVLFTDTTTAPSGDSISARAWDLDGDGATDATTASTRRAYSAPGLYQVALTDTTSAGRVGHTFHYLRVTDRPLADFSTSASQVTAGGQVTLTDASTDTDGGVVVWEWDFDYDGVTFDIDSVAQNPVTTVTHPVTVALRVRDAYGLVSAPATRTITVPGPPTAMFRSQAAGGLVNVALDVNGARLVAASTGGQASNGRADAAIRHPLNSMWRTPVGAVADQWAVYDLGQTYPITAVALSGNYSEYRVKNLRFSLGTDPADPGSFVPLVDDQLPYGTASTTFTWDTVGAPVTGRYLRLDILDNWGGNEIRIPFIQAFSGALGGPEVTFTDLSHDPDEGGAIVSWAWDFGDGTSSTEADPTHSYAAPGVYNVSLTVTDADGETASHSQRYDAKGPAAGFELSFDPPFYETTSYPFYVTARNVADRGIAGWTYDWGDGTPSSTYGYSTYTWLLHTWADNGTYTVTLTLTDTFGVQTSVSKEVEILNVAPTISVGGQNHTDGWGDPYQTYVYAGVSQAFLTRYVILGSPFTSGLEYRVNDTSAVDRAASLTCQVDWGDASAVTEVTDCANNLGTPAHTYVEPGSYTVTVTVRDKDGGETPASTPLVVLPASYLRIHPVSGTLAGGEVTLRVKLWDARRNWTLVAGAEVEVSLGDASVTITTDAEGEAEVRLPYAPGDVAEATFAGNATVAAASDSHDFTNFNQAAGDIMFLVDESGSMASHQQAVRDNLSFIAGQLAASNIDYHIGLAGMARRPYGSGPAILEMPSTAHFADFADATGLLDQSHGSDLAIDSIVQSFASRFGYRPEAAKCVVLVMDESTQGPNTATAAEAAALLAEHEATLLAVMTPGGGAYGQDLAGLATDSGGEVFALADFAADPQAVLDSLLTSCVSSVKQRPDLSVGVDDGLSRAAPGSSGAYSVTVRNDGQEPATDIALSLTLGGPQSVGAVSDAGTAVADAAGTTVTWPAFDLAAGAEVIYTVARSVAADALDDAELTATVIAADDGSNGQDLTPANNSASDGTVVATPVSLDLTVADAAKTYGDPDPAFGLTGLPAGWVEDTDYEVDYVRTPGETIDAYDISASVTVLTDGYILGSVSPGQLTIAARPVTITVASAELVHTGSQQTIDLTLSANGLRAGDSLTTLSTSVSGAAVDVYPSQLSAGQVEIARSGVDVTANYTITIEQGALTIRSATVEPVVAAAAKTYGDLDPAFSLTGLPAGWVEGADYEVTYDRAPGETVGPYDIGASVTILAAGYSLGPVSPGLLTIAPRPVTVSVASTELVHTGSEQTADLAVSASGLRDGDNLTTTSTPVTGTAVGPYPSDLAVADLVIARDSVEVTANYTITIEQGRLTITAEDAPILVHLGVADASKTHGEPDPAFALTGLPVGWAEGAHYEVTYARTPDETVGVHDITATVTVLAPGHALGTVSTGGLTIEPRPVTIVVASAERVHSGSAQTVDLALSATGLRDGDALATTTTPVTGTAVGAYPSGLTAGDVTITRAGTDTTDNYAITIDQGALTITAAVPPPEIPINVLSLSLQDETKIYGDPDPDRYSVVGLPAGWVEGVDYQIAYTRAPGETVGGHPISLASLTILNPAYRLDGDPAQISGALTIGPRPVTITIDSAEAPASGRPYTAALTAQVTAGSLAPGDSLATTAVNVTGAAPGLYPTDLAAASITGPDGERSGNYQITIVQGALTLTSGPTPSEPPEPALPGAGLDQNTPLYWSIFLASIGASLLILRRRLLSQPDRTR
jgi:PKD repeat protein